MSGMVPLRMLKATLQRVKINSFDADCKMNRVENIHFFE